jgi:hypothetical protein
LIIATDDNNECRGMIKYKLYSQIVPLDDSDWADKKKEISKLRAEKYLVILNPMTSVPKPPSFSHTMVKKVGGVMGMGASEYTCEIVFDRNFYTVGDTVRVLFKCDNSLCKIAVKSFKLKLKRKFTVTYWSSLDLKKDLNSEFKDSRSASTYIVEIKIDGCKAGEKVERTVEFNIPEIDNTP